MNKNQKGFSTLEVLLIIIVIALVGFTAWYVWKQNNKTESDNTGQPASQSQNSTNPEDIAQAENMIPDGWVEYKNARYGFSLQHPSDARLTEREDTNYHAIDIEVNNGNNPNPHVWGAGNYKIQIQVYPQTSLHDHFAELETHFATGYQRPRITTNNGVNVAEEESNPENPGEPYKIYYREKGGVMMVISILGNAPEEVTQNFVNFVEFN